MNSKCWTKGNRYAIKAGIEYGLEQRRIYVLGLRVLRRRLLRAESRTRESGQVGVQRVWVRIGKFTKDFRIFILAENPSIVQLFDNVWVFILWENPAPYHPTYVMTAVLESGTHSIGTETCTADLSRWAANAVCGSSVLSAVRRLVSNGRGSRAYLRDVQAMAAYGRLWGRKYYTVQLLAAEPVLPEEWTNVVWVWVIMSP